MIFPQLEQRQAAVNKPIGQMALSQLEPGESWERISREA